MKKVFLPVSLAVVLLSACDKDDNDNNQTGNNSTDQMFVQMAAVSNTAEIQAGQLAVTKGNTPMVRAFGQSMVMEHGMAQNDLKTVGANIGMSVQDTVDAEHRALMTRLNSLSGMAFDTAYMNSQVKDHLKTLTLFQTEIYGGANQRVVNYANTYAPHIQMHLQRADSIAHALR